MDSYSSFKKNARARFEYMKVNGRRFRGTSKNFDPEVPPEWYDREAFLRTQMLYETFGPCFQLSHLYGLILVLNNTHGIQPLLATGNSVDMSKLFIRYLSTMVHVKSWYESDPFDSKSKAFKSLRMVRGMHGRVGDQMNKASGLENGKDKELWVNQFSMANTQFAFAGLLILFPNKLGIESFSDKDFHAIMHFWRVIAYCLGTEDQFNLFSENVEENREVCRIIYYEYWLPTLLSRSEPIGIEMGKGICFAMSQAFGSKMDYNALMRYGASFLGLKEEWYPLETWTSWFSYWMMVIMFNMPKILKLEWPLRHAKYVNEMKLKDAIKNKKKYVDYLSKNYSHIRYELSETQLQSLIDYQDSFNLN